MEWNYDISQAPRGKIVEAKRQGKDGEYTLKRFEPETVILSTKCGSVVKSFWSDKRQSWSGLATGETPIAWMAWPSPAPHTEEKD